MGFPLDVTVDPEPPVDGTVGFPLDVTGNPDPPVEGGEPVDLPTAPVALAVTPNGLDARMTWQPPVSDGGSPIRTYKVGWQAMFPIGNGAFTGTAYVAGTHHVWKKLQTGKKYAFSVQAVNSDGVHGSWAQHVIVTMPAGVR